MEMSVRTRRHLLLGLVIVVAVVLFYLANSGPVLLSFAPRAVLSPTPLWSLLNPLRDRDPERAAEALLRELRAGKAREAFSRLHLDPPIKPEAIEDEQHFTLVSWRLVEREDLSNHTELAYNCARVDHPGNARRPVWIRIERPPGGGTWQVTSYSAFY